jgi:hypothetical protein
MAKEISEFDKQMVQLEGELRRLETEYNMFFAGRLKRPPFETKNRVDALVKRTDRSFIRNTGDRFRFESIQNRYQKFLELVDRQMMNRELGRPSLGVKPHATTATQKGEAAKRDPNIIRFGKDAKTGQDSDAVKQLYERLAQEKKKAGEAPVAIERLAALVKAQVEKFGAEGKNVDFKIGTKDGKVTLTAKPADEK